MKNLKLSILAITIAATLFSCNTSSVKRQTSLNSALDSVSYAVGIDIAKNLSRTFNGFNEDLVYQAFKDLKDSTDLLIQEKDTRKVVSDYRAKKHAEELKEKYGKVKEDGIKFLEANKLKPGVKITASGLQYIVVKEGTGKKPTVTDKVKVHYHGTTPEGVVFDSSVDRKKPIDFNLTQVIKGWTEGLQLMKEGAKYKLFIPQELAYGERAPQGGNGPIKPYMPLVFDVELIKILPKK